MDTIMATVIRQLWSTRLTEDEIARLVDFEVGDPDRVEIRLQI